MTECVSDGLSVGVSNLHTGIQQVEKPVYDDADRVARLSVKFELVYSPLCLRWRPWKPAVFYGAHGG